MNQYRKSLKIADNCIVENATQRTITIIGGKGTGKTTLIKILMDSEERVLVFDPLNVINFDSNAYRIKINKKYDTEKIKGIAKIINTFLNEKKNVVVYFDEMVRDEIVEKVDQLFPLLSFRDGFVIFDEIHEFTPHYSGSMEVERFIRHCRNKNIGIIMSTQRPASVATNVIALTDFLILFRITWKNDTKSVREIIQYQADKKEVDEILKNIQKFDFMEGYAIDFA